MASRRVLLISTNRCSTPDPVFPLGLAHLNAAVRRAGHSTRWLDLHTDGDSLANALREYQPDIVGISIRNIDDVLIRKRETYYGELPALCETVRQAHPCPIILGGSGFSIFPERLLELSGADFGIQGEGEAGLPSLILTLGNGDDYDAIPGLVFRRGRQIVVNSQRPAPVDAPLDTCDRPSQLVRHYLQTTGMLNLQTQRGCAHLCCYCTYPLIEGCAHRRRPPEVIADEMAQLEGLGAKYVFITDSVFNSSALHVTETCEAIIRHKLSLRWGCFLRPKGLTPELVKLMARAGLTHIEFGTDSFCDEVLAAYQKDFTFDDVCRSSELARRENLDFCHFLICGGPGETLETLQTGFLNSRRLDGAVIMAVVGMRIYPGTTLHHRALQEGHIAAGTDLLAPTYYVAPGLTTDDVFVRLRDFATRSPNWIVGDPEPAYTSLVERLRQRGVVGPLWSYFAMIQRLWSPGLTGGAIS
jgi:radical SAM superfamily enzyme YgiQ (UPF0313 family)